MRGSVFNHQLRFLAAILLGMNGLALCVVAGDEAAVDLIGRGNTFTVIDRDGDTQEVEESSLSVQGSGRSYAPRREAPAPPTSSEERPAGDTDVGPEKETPAGEQPAGAEGTAKGTSEDDVKQVGKPVEEPKEETPEEKAAREADIRSIRAMLDQGGAYFYDENNNPLSYQQVNTMIKEGDVENVRAQGLHLSSWSPSLDEVRKEEGKTTTSAASSYGASTSPGTKKSVHEVVAEGTPFRQTVKDNKPFDPKAYSAGTPEDGKISPLAVPEDRRPFREVLNEEERKPFDPKDDYTKSYLPDTK